MTKHSPKEFVVEYRSQRVTTPIVLQMHATECGAACLRSVLAYFGLWVPLTELRRRCEVSRDGSTAAGISRAAQHYGLECKGMSLSVELLKKLPVPLVLFWQFSHFVVLEGFGNNEYYLNDPASGRRKVSEEEFQQGYSGIALRFSRGENFKEGGTQPSLFQQLSKLLQHSKAELLAVVVCTLFATILTLVIPITLGSFVDEVLIKQSPWLGFVLALFGAGILVYTLTLLKNRLLQRLSIKISVIGYERGLTKLLRLPIEFFEHRLIGDLTDRVSSIDRVAKNLTTQFVVLMLDILMSIVLLVAMVFLNWVLAFTVLVLGVVHISLALSLNHRRHIRGQALRREQGLMLGLGMQMLSHADNLRITGADDRHFSSWSGHQARELNARQRFVSLSAFNDAIPELITGLRSGTILFVGALAVLAGNMSLGILVACFILSEILLEPITRFLEFEEKRHVLETDIQRLEDIELNDEDPSFQSRAKATEAIPIFQGKLKLTGDIELKDVTFGYNPRKRPLIQGLSLKVRPGQRIAIVGPSGSGKSTLARLIVGINQPTSGQIWFDRYPQDEIPQEVIRRSISMVNQEAMLFEASVRDNITMWNSAVPDDVVVSATRDARIHREILQRPDGYETIVEEGGANFSGGQRQRLELARALASKPTILVLDEATSSLDAATEEAVDEALRRRGVTCVIVAHRLSTVRDCDEIIVLDGGQVVQRGTHDTLIADQSGTYYTLAVSG